MISRSQTRINIRLLNERLIRIRAVEVMYDGLNTT